MSIDAERSPAFVGAENLCVQNPGLWDSADTPGRRAATKLCWQCPLFEACQRTLTAHVASGNVPREQVFAGVAFDGEGRIDPDVHSIEGAAALAASYDVPVGEGGSFRRRTCCRCSPTNRSATGWKYSTRRNPAGHPAGPRPTLPQSDWQGAAPWWRRPSRPVRWRPGTLPQRPVRAGPARQPSSRPQSSAGGQPPRPPI